MPVYVWRDGHWRDKATGERAPLREGLCAPMAIISDIPAYQSPVDGRTVGGRRQMREDLARNGCTDSREFYGDKPALGGKLKNKRFAEKHGLTAHLKEELR